MTVAIGNDHAGVALKETLSRFLEARDITVKNLGTDSTESTDYPDWAREVALAVVRGEADLGIAICGTGVGASIAANKVRGIRAAVCYNVFTATMARRHNDANVITFGARTTRDEDATAMLEAFLRERFQGERHKRRIDKISKIEENNFRNKK